MVTSTPFTNSAEVYKWISGFINFEKGQIKRDFSLDGMKILAEMAGHPEKCAPAFHIAGSKGKGSVTGMITAILEASGKKIARYASPHISDFRERISSGNSFFNEEIYTLTGNELKALVEKLPLQKREEPSFFELFTLWFFLCARQAHCDAMTVETGLGGRLDATNILDPLMSIITSIELEHTEILGDTITAIAAEKAGIIKKRRPLVLAEQTDEALAVFREYAARNESPFFYFPEWAEVRNVRLDQKGTIFTLVLQNESFNDLFIPMPGEVQAKNSSLAILALKTSLSEITERDIRQGLATFTLPARFERISDTPPVVIDGAHTKHSVNVCLQTFTSLYGNGGILVFGCATGKDVLSMAELCVRCFKKIIITKPGTFKESNPEEIYTAFLQAAERFKSNIEIIFQPQTNKAIEKAIELAMEQELPILGTGSFYLAGEIRKRFFP